MSRVVEAFLQISDLHIAKPGGVGERGSLPAWATFPWFDGLLGHDEFSLARLEKLWRQTKRTIASAKLLITGDLSCTGDWEELERAALFLGADWVPPHGNFLGLRYPDWKTHTIPGNHDQWGGNIVFGPPSNTFVDTFPACPYVTQPVEISSTGHTVVFAGLNSDAGVGPYSSSRGLALGEFRTELEQLEKVLNIPEENEIRVLLLHHSATWTGRTLRIRTACKKLLDEFVVRHGFSILLCGHTHVHQVEKLRIKHLSSSAILHACCGSSSRITALPMRVAKAQQWISRPDWLANSVLSHELSVEPQGLRWSVKSYFERSHGFELTLDTTLSGGAPSLFFPHGKGRPLDA